MSVHGLVWVDQKSGFYRKYSNYNRENNAVKYMLLSWIVFKEFNVGIKIHIVNTYAVSWLMDIKYLKHKATISHYHEMKIINGSAAST